MGPQGDLTALPQTRCLDLRGPLRGKKGGGAGRDKRERRGEVRKDYLPCHQFLDPPLCASVLSAG